MRNNWILLIAFLPFPGLTQDSLKPSGQRLNSVVERFKDITGPDVNYIDSISSLKGKVYVEEQRNNALTDSVNYLRDRLKISQKELLIARYGGVRSTAYGLRQYKDFKNNLFLQEYFSDTKGVQVFFAFDESETDLTMYDDELTSIVAEMKQNSSRMLHITASADSYGSGQANSRLSAQRARFVYEYLVTKLKIDPARIRIENSLPNQERVTEPELDFLNRRAVIRLENL